MKRGKSFSTGSLVKSRGSMSEIDFLTDEFISAALAKGGIIKIPEKLSIPYSKETIEALNTESHWETDTMSYVRLTYAETLSEIALKEQVKKDFKMATELRKSAAFVRNQLALASRVAKKPSPEYLERLKVTESTLKDLASKCECNANRYHFRHPTDEIVSTLALIFETLGGRVGAGSRAVPNDDENDAKDKHVIDGPFSRFCEAISDQILTAAMVRKSLQRLKSKN